MADYSDLFSTDPFASRWTQNYIGTIDWPGSYIRTTVSGGGHARYNTDIVSISQYGKILLFGGTGPGASLDFRMTTSSSNYWYEIELGATTADFKLKNTATVQSISSGSLSFAIGDTAAATLVGTGTSTTVRIWKNPTNNTPYDYQNWDSASDPPDLTLDASGGATGYADSGTYIGAGAASINRQMDNWYGGSVVGPSSPALPIGRIVVEARSDGTIG